MRLPTRLALAGALVAVLTAPALADTTKAIAAYQAGDYETAMSELQAAADAGDAQAFYNLGVAHAEGKAVPQDWAKALDFYQKGAEGGSVLAAFNLGQAYRKGDGTQIDYAEAAKWYEMAAKRGDYRAASELGLLYVQGQGVKADLVEGFAWNYTATHASIMDEYAMANAIQLASMLTEDEMAVAQKRGQDYFERYMAPNEVVVNAILTGQ